MKPGGGEICGTSARMRSFTFDSSNMNHIYWPRAFEGGGGRKIY